MSELEKKYLDDDVAFFKINVDEYPEFTRNHSIRAIPCVLVYFEGKLQEIEDPDNSLKKTDRLLGRRSYDVYEAVIRQFLS
jgi:hypothetical protein